MNDKATDLSIYQKYFYFLSFPFFVLLFPISIFSLFFFVTLFVLLIKSDIPFKKLRELSASEIIISIISFVLLILINSKENYLISIALSLMASYFVINSVSFVSSFFKTNENLSYLNKSTGKLTTYETITIVVSAIVGMTFFTTSSPLYKINYWGDSQIFFTIGRSILKGIVPYRDIFDHKGPYLYLIHVIAALISDKNFIGVYILETIGAIIYSLLLWKTIRLFINLSKFALLIIPFQIIVTFSAYSFSYGDSAEEFAIPFLMAVIYIALKAEKEKQLPSLSKTFLIGFISGTVFFIKFSFCALILGYVIYVVIISITRKTIPLLPKYIGVFIGGVVIAILPAIIYLLINNAVSDFIDVYFIKNVFLYPKAEMGFKSISENFSFFSLTMSRDNILCLFIVFSVISLLAVKKEFKLMYSLWLILTAAIVYGTKVCMFNYCYILFPLTVPGWIFITVFFDKLCTKCLQKSKLLTTVPVLLMTAVIFVTSTANLTIWFLGQPKNEIPQLTFAEIINEKENATLLTFRIYDEGFYLYSETIPNCKYPYHLNLTEQMPELEKTQITMINNHEFDFIVTDSGDYNFDGYRLVKAQDYYYFYLQGFTAVKTVRQTFYLYELTA